MVVCLAERVEVALGGDPLATMNTSSSGSPGTQESAPQAWIFAVLVSVLFYRGLEHIHVA